MSYYACSALLSHRVGALQSSVIIIIISRTIYQKLRFGKPRKHVPFPLVFFDYLSKTAIGKPSRVFIKQYEKTSEKLLCVHFIYFFLIFFLLLLLFHTDRECCHFVPRSLYHYVINTVDGCSKSIICVMSLPFSALH